jgi:beta-1,4-N-acetylglucosaminyltransferase
MTADRETPASRTVRMPQAGTDAHRKIPACLLVASSGGHLLQLHRMVQHLGDVEQCWVTFDTPDALSLLADKRVVHAPHPTNRNLKNLIRNAFLAARLMRSLRPAIVVSTGAGVGVPFCWLGRLTGARVVFVESFTRTHGASLSGRLVIPIVHLYFVQWSALASKYIMAEYVGRVF